MKHVKYTTAVLCVLALMLLVVPAMAALGKTPSKGGGGRIEPVTYKPGEVIVIWKGRGHRCREDARAVISRCRARPLHSS